MKTFQPNKLCLSAATGKNSNKFLNRFLPYLFISAFILINNIKSAAQPGEALQFDGVNDYVVAGNVLPSGSYTKEAWVNASFFTSTSSNIISGTVSAFWAPSGNLSAGHNGAYTSVQDAGAMSTGTWYHVAVTYNAGTNTLTLYRDGVQVATGSASGTYSETNIFIGTFNGGSMWGGLIDEVRIWNVVRTGTEIANNRNCILTGDEPGLVAYYDFDQGTASGNNLSITSLSDRSDKCTPTDGTLTNFALTGVSSNWVAPGAGIAGSCSGTFPNANIEGNSVCINDGDGTPSSGDHTDFGVANLFTRTFTIENTGSALLTITGVSISGANAAEFSVTSAPASTVAAGGSTTFNVTFTAASNGVKNATVTVNSDDGDEAAYDFAIRGSFFTLPVELKSFSVRKDNSRSQLNWVTSSENNNRGFEIQRSADGINWSAIGFVQGAGNSANEQFYSYTDPTPQKGKNNYRLKQIDLDNKAKFSQVRSVTFAGDYTIVYPVPTADNIIIELKDSKLIGTRAVLADQNGKVIKQIMITKMQQQVSLISVSPGIYFLRMDDGSTHKLVKQ